MSLFELYRAGIPILVPPPARRAPWAAAPIAAAGRRGPVLSERAWAGAFGSPPAGRSPVPAHPAAATPHDPNDEVLSADETR